MTDQNIVSENPLQGKRDRIDEIDAGILVLLDERMRLASDIAEIKRKTGKDILDLDREAQLFKKLLAKNKAQESLIPDEKVLEIWGKIIELSKKIQENEPNAL